MSWNNLSMKDRASYIRMGVENGITDLDAIREIYNKFAEGGPIKKSYKDFSTRLSKAWNNENLSKHDYDYQKYYNDDPEEAYRQLESIEHGGKGHFPDGGKSGTYKTPNHPTYPDLGSNSWLNNDRIFNISARQANQGLDNIRDEINTDRILDYLGSDLNYNRGATRVMYDGAYQLPEVTVTPDGNYTELVPNELNTGWMYRDRAGRFDDVDYSYLDNYLGNKKSLGGNLYGNGGWFIPKYDSKIRRWRDNHGNIMQLGHKYRTKKNGVITYKQYNSDGTITTIPHYNLNTRIHSNTSKTPQHSASIEDQIHNVVLNAMRSQNYKPQYNIPYTGRTIKVGTMNIDVAGLDSVAKYAGLQNRNPQYPKYTVKSKNGLKNISFAEAVGLPFQETTGGRTPSMTSTNLPKETLRALYNADYLKAYGSLPANMYVNDHGYFADVYSNYPNGKEAVLPNTPPLAHAMQVYSNGSYNPGDPDHYKKVIKSGKLVIDALKDSPYYNEVQDFYTGKRKALGGNLFGNGGSKPRYRSSSNIRKQISTWEGSTMRTNVPFDRMDTMFNQVLPAGALDKLSQSQLDGLYSFAYNVGTGRFKTRTAPTLAKYLQGNATIEDVKSTMWASGDKKYRGLANRRKKERSMLGAYVPVQEAIPMTTPLATPLATPIDITPAAQPIIESNPVIQDNIETLPLAFNTESQKESDYTPGFFNYVNYINQIRQPKQPKQRDRRIWLTI